MRQSQMMDWITDLEEFGPQVVTDACAEWRRGSEKKPLIAQIRKICLEMKPRPLALPPPVRDVPKSPGMPIHLHSTDEEVRAYELLQKRLRLESNEWECSPEGQEYFAMVAKRRATRPLPPLGMTVAEFDYEQAKERPIAPGDAARLNAMLK